MRLFMFYDSIIDACRVDQNIVTQLRIRRVRLVIPQNLSVWVSHQMRYVV
jgi:hypothetical protein